MKMENLSPTHDSLDFVHTHSINGKEQRGTRSVTREVNGDTLSLVWWHIVSSVSVWLDLSIRAHHALRTRRKVYRS